MSMGWTTPVAGFGGWINGAVGLAAALLLVASLPAAGQGTIAGLQGVFVGVPVQKVALEGEVAPGTGGAKFTSFDEPMVNSTGRVAFGANYSGGGGVFLGSGSGALSKVVASGDTITGLGAVTITGTSDLDGPAISNNGTVALVISSTSTQALVQKTLAGSPTVLAKAGDAAPGTTGSFVSFDDISQNHNDDVAFIAYYTEDAGATTHPGVWLKPFGGALAKIIKFGDPVPAGAVTCPSGFAGNNIDGPWMNDSRVVALKIDGPCGDDPPDSADQVLVKVPAQALATFVAEGDVAPVFLGGGTLGGITMGRPALNNSNTLVFRTNGDDDIPAIVTKTLTGTFTLCVKDLSSAPGTAGNFDGLAETAAINVNGEVFVQADVANGGNVTAGIFACRNGTVRPIALEGDPVPATSQSFTACIEEGSIGDSGQVTFLQEGGCFFVAPIPTVSEWSLVTLALALAGLGFWQFRRQRNPIKRLQ